MGDFQTSGHQAMISRIQTSTFGITRLNAGYDERSVDDFLDEVVRIFAAGQLPDPVELRDATFSTTRLRPGYAIPDVRALLDEIAQYSEAS